MAQAQVRPAVAGDGLAMAWIQLEVWRTAFSGLLPDDVLQTPAAQLAASWTAALHATSQTVLMATEGAEAVGFVHAAVDPDDRTTGRILVLHVRPAWARRGHGGRLLATAAAALRDAGASVGEWWVPETDTATRRFVGVVGWEMSGGARVLDTGRAMMTERRWTGTLDLQLSG
ncbi:GNAT family N-acetyltransferase [Nakamurella deserti]|uniref:GNAT family N-acetyltransferase n=1 Tax=Nakamurella deserti TaxID=2164074 RepID=UPI000DBE838B|nr:GNAT family N-acetyltransferase [Nakamurella deserti]